MGDLVSFPGPSPRAVAEAQLIDLLRTGTDGNDFTLKVSVSKSGQWLVQTEAFTGALSIGQGGSFHEAWLNQDPRWAPLDYMPPGGRREP